MQSNIQNKPNKTNKRRMKPLLPSLREKKRYLAFEIISKKRVDNMVNKQISESCLRFLGTKGAAEAGLIFLKYDKEKQKGLIRVNHRYLHNLKAALALISEIGNEEVIVRSVGVSGILNKAEERYIAS